MTTQPVCAGCKGSGLGPRQGDEAKADLWPILSQKPGLCDKCGGSGYEAKPTHAINVSTAKGQCG